MPALLDRQLDGLAHLLAAGCDMLSAATAMGLPHSPTQIAAYAGLSHVHARVRELQSKESPNGCTRQSQT